MFQVVYAVENNIGKPIAIRRLADSAIIPLDPLNQDFRDFLVWNAAQPIPLDYVSTTSPPLVTVVKRIPFNFTVTTPSSSPITLAQGNIPQFTAWGLDGELFAVNLSTGALRRFRASATAKRLGGNVQPIIGQSIVYQHGDPATAGWTVTASTSNPDIFAVTVQSDANVEWHLDGILVVRHRGVLTSTLGNRS